MVQVAACLDLIPAGHVDLLASLKVPAAAKGVVIFAHGSGSSRSSPRNVLVARLLREAGLGTLLFDLLTPEEEREERNRLDIDLLAGRVLAAARWVSDQPQGRRLGLGLFGSSTGAAAALKAASALGERAQAVVSRGGRPDLAGKALEDVRAPTLLIVGEMDRAVLELNREALRRLPCRKRLALVSGATHLFEEPGTLEEAAGLAAGWFNRWLVREGEEP